jgi:hypothetical protein
MTNSPPVFELAKSERLFVTRHLFLLNGNLPCPRGVTNRKSAGGAGYRLARILFQALF